MVQLPSPVGSALAGLVQFESMLESQLSLALILLSVWSFKIAKAFVFTFESEPELELSPTSGRLRTLTIQPLAYGRPSGRARRPMLPQSASSNQILSWHVLNPLELHWRLRYLLATRNTDSLDRFARPAPSHH